MRRIASVLALALAVPAASLQAQGTGLGIVGLGLPGRFVAARDAGMGGGITLFDAEATLNPAAVGRWRAAAGWAVAAPSRMSLDAWGDVSQLRSTRFPLFGFASRLMPRLAIGVSISDFLDRSFEVTRRDSTEIRGDTIPFTETSRSQGGVSDLRLAAAYTLGDRAYLGVAIHAYAGSSRLVFSRAFDGDDYEDLLEISQTDYSGMGLSLGTLVSVVPGLLDAGLSLRFGADLTAKNTSGRISKVPLPTDFAFGVHTTPSAGIGVAATVQRTGWSRAAAALAAAGQRRPRDTWSAAVGVEVLNVDLGLFHSPLRLGYRYRQLPFSLGSADLDESAVSGGFSISFAHNRTTLDVAIERGSRAGSGIRESFTALYLGVTVRP